MITMSGRGRVRKLENDCLNILLYACSYNGKWVSIKNIHEKYDIPESTLRTIFSVAKRGFFTRKTDTGYFMANDVMAKIARKHRITFLVKKIAVPKRNMMWHISAVGPRYGDAL